MTRTKLDFTIIAKSAIILIAMIYPLSYAHEFGHAIVCAGDHALAWASVGECWRALSPNVVHCCTWPDPQPQHTTTLLPHAATMQNCARSYTMCIHNQTASACPLVPPTASYCKRIHNCSHVCFSMHKKHASAEASTRHTTKQYQAMVLVAADAGRSVLLHHAPSSLCSIPLLQFLEIYRHELYTAKDCEGI